MSSEMIIRRYRPSDQDVVTDLWSRAARQAHPFLDGEGAGERARLLREVDLVRAENWVAERKGSVIGLLGLRVDGPGDGDGPEGGDGPGAEVGGLFVAPEAQGGGAGRELLEHAAALHGALTLEVFEGNGRGRRFCAYLGFTERGRRTDEETGHPLITLERAAPLKSVGWLHLREGRLLSVRTRGNDTFYLPGGKYEPGETAREALSRELGEELGLVVPAEELSEACVIHDVAHGKNGRRLQMTCFTGGPQDIAPVPGREIAEYAWFDRQEARERCAPAHAQVVDRLVAQGRMRG
ncbi:GNAT family N-acetyltransferase [Streptomyces sp. Isolate_219]|uniref:GNAT family N-acetyltransferase n=1 Tax=Streptomyces sp. Isolate_219 TaxID=2950110 RepID=UPI0021C56B3B|nr:GNAT family N-acetyltransferase [Streptomyces sp. Isolate_219]MCR8572923.1 GNAT family N-acetyltransferase [Streptomyces sp. Isolate_219]